MVFWTTLWAYSSIASVLVTSLSSSICTHYVPITGEFLCAVVYMHAMCVPNIILWV